MADNLGLHLHIDTFRDRVGGGDPLAIVEQAVTEMRRRTRNHGKYVGRAILLDSDRLEENPERDQRAIRLAHNENIVLIFQNPDHEAFLLRHFQGHEKDRPSRGTSQRVLLSVWPVYQKPMIGQDLHRRFSIEDLQRACITETILRAPLKTSPILSLM
ncbi:MAG: hypothetical protein O2807_06820 [bacterium]|nr:hypothetical protein [bacterium]